MRHPEYLTALQVEVNHPILSESWSRRSWMRLTEKRQTVGVSSRSVEKSTAYFPFSRLPPLRPATFLRSVPSMALDIEREVYLILCANISVANCLPPQKEILAQWRSLHRNILLLPLQDNFPLPYIWTVDQRSLTVRALSLAELGPANPGPDLS